jgi:DNA-3-methyladenine glycosylase
LNLRPLARRFYRREALEVAPDLLGRLLVRELDGALVVGRIVETEAYGPQDPASHSYPGPRRANLTMFGPPGHAYVYVSHGIHHCMNAVCRPPSAVLIRALEPVAGIEAMARRRGLSEPPLLCAGPGRLCHALSITLADDGRDLTAGEGLWVAPGSRSPAAVVTPRVGITVAVERPWRFVLPETRFASRPLPGRRRGSGSNDD